MKKPKRPYLDASLSNVKIDPHLSIKSGERYISIQETAPCVLVRFALNTKGTCRFIDVGTEADFEKLWNKLMEISEPCH